MPHTLYQTAELLVMAEDFETEVVFVSFNTPGFPPPGKRAWEDRLFAGAKIAAIHVFAAVPDWYPPSRIQPAIPAILAAARGRRLVTFGQGHGGYGALKHAAALGAEAALAFSPPWSIDPADIGSFDQRFAKQFGGGGGARIAAADLCPANFLVFDPFVPADRRHAGHIAAAAPDRVAELIAPLTLGTPGRLLAEARAGANLAALFAGGALPDGPALRRLLRACRANSATYQTGRIRIAARRPAAGLDFLKNLAAGLPEQKRDIIILEALAAARRFPLAVTLLETIPEAALREAGLPKLRRQFRSAGFLKGEIHLAPMIMRAYEGSPAEYLDAVDTYVFADMTEEAGEALAKVLTFSDVLGQLNRLLALAGAAKSTDICELIAQLLIDEQSIGIRDRVEAGVKLADFCDKFGSRPIALAILKKMQRLSADDPHCLDMVAAGFERITALSMSLVIRERLASLFPDSIIRMMDIIALETRRLSEGRRTSVLIAKRFKEIMKNPENSYEFWQRASSVYKYRGNFSSAIAAMNKAIQLGAEESQARSDLARLHFLNEDIGRARSEILKVAQIPAASHNSLMVVEKLSRVIGDMALAAICAKRIYENSGLRQTSALLYMRALIDAQDYNTARSLIRAHLQGEAGTFWVSQEKLLDLAAEASRLDSYEMVAEIVERGLEFNPANVEFLERQEISDQRRRLLGGAVEGPKPLAVHRRKSLVARFISDILNST